VETSFYNRELVVDCSDPAIESLWRLYETSKSTEIRRSWRSTYSRRSTIEIRTTNSLSLALVYLPVA